MRTRPQPQTEIWGNYHKANRRTWFASAIGLALAVLPAIMLTDGLPIEQRLLWISGAALAASLACGWLIQNSSGEPWTTTTLLAAEAALVEVVGSPTVIVAVWSAPDLEQQLQTVQGLSSLTVSPAALIAVGSLGFAVGPSRPHGVATQFIERNRVDDVRVTPTPKYEQRPTITVPLRSRRAAPVAVEFAPASRLPASRWVARSHRPPQADEREVCELVAAMRLALGRPSS